MVKGVVGDPVDGEEVHRIPACTEPVRSEEGGEAEESDDLIASMSGTDRGGEARERHLDEEEESNAPPVDRRGHTEEDLTPSL